MFAQGWHRAAQCAVKVEGMGGVRGKKWVATRSSWTLEAEENGRLTDGAEEEMQAKREEAKREEAAGGVCGEVSRSWGSRDADAVVAFKCMGAQDVIEMPVASTMCVSAVKEALRGRLPGRPESTSIMLVMAGKVFKDNALFLASLASLEEERRRGGGKDTKDVVYVVAKCSGGGAGSYAAGGGGTSSALASGQGGEGGGVELEQQERQTSRLPVLAFPPPPPWPPPPLPQQLARRG